MDKEKLKAYGIDYENAVKRFAGNEALYERFLKKLTEDDHLAIGEQAMKEERYEDVLEAVHALKGVAGTLGMTELFQAASEVVASIRKNEISHLQEQMAKGHTEFEKFAEQSGKIGMIFREFPTEDGRVISVLQHIFCEQIPTVLLICSNVAEFF